MSNLWLLVVKTIFYCIILVKNSQRFNITLYCVQFNCKILPKCSFLEVKTMSYHIIYSVKTVIVNGLTAHYM